VSAAEANRLAEDEPRFQNWKRWGPYLAERRWGTVREDCSEHGEVWDYFLHDHARSRAYRWGDDGPSRHLRSAEQALLCARPMERSGSYSEGTSVWSVRLVVHWNVG
jgi:hypothetical protein